MEVLGSEDVEPMARFIQHHLAWTMVEQKHFRSLARALIPWINEILKERSR